MKKTYIIPFTRIVELGCETLIAESFKLSSTKVEEADGGFVKGESASTPSYNVWDDDWSK